MQGIALLSGKQSRQTRQKDIKEEIAMSAMELMRRRQERMKELFNVEKQKYERELADMGLALSSEKP